MSRVVVFQGLGVAEPNQALPPGVWQRGQPSPAREDAIWYRTRAIRNRTEFPPTNPTPAANCRMCDPGDTSPDCCVHSDNMPLYTDWGTQAYQASFKPWNQSSQTFMQPPTTSEVVGQALEQSLNQARLESAPLPESPAATLSGFLASSGQNHLLGNAQGQQHLLGYTPRYSPFGCSSCGSKLNGVFTDDTGSLTTTGKVAIGVGVAAAAFGAYKLFSKKRR